ncbi:MAG: exodeoxyribonuclease III [Saprospiraceae bacterium]|nr:exodeoxyribonuclease III [Saprospiraceae bacterium]
MSFKIASYNINGLRSAIANGFWDWLPGQGYDVICFQEIKSSENQIDTSVIESMGYHHFWHSAEKKGYSGVATFCKVKPDYVHIGMDNSRYDVEGRVLRTDFGDLTVLNCYFPSGSSSEERHQFKMEFLSDFEPYIQKLSTERPNLIITGDYNIVHKGLDIHNPDRKDNPSGYRPDERAWMDQWFDKMGFTDAFRYKHPTEKEYSWWSFRAGSKKKNLGWRIDYISLSQHLLPHLKEAGHRPDVLFSDHCPVEVVLDLNF